MAKFSLHRQAIVINLLAVAAILVITGCATMPKDFERPESYVLTDAANTAFAEAFTAAKAAHSGKSGFHLLGNGLDAFVARTVLSNHAEHSIDVQYYLYHDDLMNPFTPIKRQEAILWVALLILCAFATETHAEEESWLVLTPRPLKELPAEQVGDNVIPVKVQMLRFCRNGFQPRPAYRRGWKPFLQRAWSTPTI